MTVAEARAFIEKAETLPIADVDRERLAEALGVLMKAGAGISIAENEILLRARALAFKANLMPTIGLGQITTATGETIDVPEMDPTFIRRLFEAASEAQIPEAQVRAVVSQAQQMAAQSGGEFSPDFLLQPQLDAWEAEAEALRGRPIGVQPGFVAIREGRDLGGSTFGGEVDPAIRRRQVVEPRYFEGDEFSPAGLDPAAITEIQTRLVAAGLMEPGEFWAGFWDSGTSGAYRAALGMANQSGLGVDAALDELARTLPDSIKEARAQAAAAKVFQAPPFISPDYASLAQDVKGYFRSKVGRDPTTDELAQLTSTMSGLYRADYEAEVTALRSQFEASQSLVPVTAPTIGDVDPAARFRELFDAKFAPEISRLESLDDVRANASNVFASLRTMSSLVGSR